MVTRESFDRNGSATAEALEIGKFLFVLFVELIAL
jgi:hypothetical protein